VFIRNYDILKPLNSGGTATVYLAVDVDNGSLVAVKKLKSAFLKNEVLRQKFIDEANRYLYLDHPNIVKIKDFILTEHQGFLIMEYVEGVNLRNWIEKVGALPAQNIALFSLEILKALKFAHLQNVLHLDIKPANVMLSDSNEIKLIDFGISSEAKKSPSEIMGSPFYMSPEQITGKNIDCRSDIYSLGITIFEMFTGTLPFMDSKTRDELFKNIIHTEIPNVNSNFPGDREYLNKINEIIGNCTAKSPNDRYQNCEELSLDLQTLLT
jgi:serine/threonine-protein kinase